MFLKLIHERHFSLHIYLFTKSSIAIETKKLIFLKVEVHERQVMLQATKGDDLGGWVAIDDITVVENVDCIVFPGDDAVHN